MKMSYSTLAVFYIFSITHSQLLVSAQDQWSGFSNTIGSLLNFSCPDNSVVTGIASDYSSSLFDRQWEFRCGTSQGLASVPSNCTLQPAINLLQGEISFSCPDGGYISGFTSEFTASRFDRVWSPYCCTRAASTLVNCQLPTSRYENLLRANLNFTAPDGQIIAGIQSFYFNRDRRWRYQTCQIEVNCGDPGVPANGRRLGDRFLYRDSVTFECEDGYYQSSGPEGGVRECLITGKWSATQPVCSQCGVIGACAQVLCTNSSDHRCLDCESNHGHLPGQMAYTNLGTECEARCSWLRSFCYPGVCPDTPLSCDCEPGFQGPNCLQISATPILQTCQLVLEGINGSRLHTSCLSVNDTTHVFTNIRPHQLRGMWEGIYIGPSSLPSRPAYIPTNGYSVGVAVSEMTASVFRAANPNDAVTESAHDCGAISPPSPDTPRPGLTSCSTLATPTSLANHTFLHGDMFEVLVSVSAGGFLDIINLDINTTTRHYYTGPPIEEGTTFTLDFQPPSHCSLSLPSSPSCSPDQALLALSGEIVSNGTIRTTWGGWQDLPSGVRGYILSVYPLEESGGILHEGIVAVETTVYNHTDDTVYDDQTELTVEGPYSFVLQTFDEAGNVRYSRRTILFDNSSFIGIEESAPLIVTSAVPQTNFMWQNSTSKPITISGQSHFFNSALLGSNILAPVGEFSTSIVEEYDHPLNDGQYPRVGTPNAVGVVRLFYDVTIDQVGGVSPESLSLPETFEFETEDIGIREINISADLQDGDSVRVWFLAIDFKFQQINDSVLVHVDSSGPFLSDLGLEWNGVTDLKLHGTDSFTHLNIQFTTYDQHSGIFALEWNIGTSPGLNDIGSGNVPVQVVPLENCSQPYCVCDSVGHCSSIDYTYSPEETNLNISRTNHDTNYYITITATNHALLSSSTSLIFTVDTTPPLPGAVFDAPLGETDIDYQTTPTLTGWWAGFFDRETDILFYQYMFGKECGNSSVFTLPLDPESSVRETNMNSATTEAQGEGTYYLTVVGWNAALSPSVPICSDGITVDMVLPEFQGVVIPGAVMMGGLIRDLSGEVWLVDRDRTRKIVRGGANNTECINRATLVSEVSIYPIKMEGLSWASVSPLVCVSALPFPSTPLTLITNDGTLNVSWLATDNVGIREFYIGISSSLNYITSGEIEYYETAGHSHYSLFNSNVLLNGNQFYISFRAEDLSLHMTTVTVGPILIDLTPPIINGTVAVQQHGSHVLVTWEEEAISEQEEGRDAVSIQYAIGLTMYGDEVLLFQPLPNAASFPCPTSSCIVINSTFLLSGLTYYITLSVTNLAGLSSFISSSPYHHAAGLPTSGLVLDFDPSAIVEVVGGFSYHTADIDILLEGEKLGVHWSGFAHPSLPVVYWVSLGTGPGLDDTFPLTPLGEGVYEYIFTDAVLMDGSVYYATVVARTSVSATNSSSNGVLILRNNEVALNEAVVYDGSSAIDVDYQVSLSAVSAQWFYPNELHIHISHYMWGILREVQPLLTSGSGSAGDDDSMIEIISDYQNVGKDTSGVIPVLTQLESDGTRYINAIKACFATKCLSPIYSDGFQISVPPRPGSIRAVYTPLEQDEIYGTSSSGRLDLVWENFSDPQIVFYEWTLGTRGSGAELLIPWKQVEWFENQVSVIINVTVSLHRTNTVTLRGYNSAGLHSSTSTLMEWNVGGVVLHQNLVPRSSLVVFDVSKSDVSYNPSITDWRDLVYVAMETEDIDYTDSGSTLSGMWTALRYTFYSYSVSSDREYLNCPSRSSLACGSTLHNSATISNLPLVDGQTYYFCVQALQEHAIHRTDATPPVLEVCSNGVTVDLSAPQGGCVKIFSPSLDIYDLMIGSGVETTRLRHLNCNSVNDTRFQVSHSELYLVWNEFLDAEQSSNRIHSSGVAYYQYAIGTAPQAFDTVNFTSVGVATYAVIRGLSLQLGATYYATIQAVDFTGKLSHAVSRGMTIDFTAPSIGGVQLIGTTKYQSGLALEWNAIKDVESDIISLEWGLGSQPGSSDIIGWTGTRLEYNTRITLNTTGLELYEGQLVFASLKVKNGAGLVSVASSQGYILDSSPPEVGVVFDGPPTSPHVDIDYWSDMRVVRAHWRGFTDPHTGIADYQWSIGTCQACTDVQPFISTGLLPAGSRSDLSLSPGTGYYVTVRACNPLGMCSEASSNGAIVDDTPPTVGHVLDGLMLKDLQYFTSLSVVSAHWTGFHDVQSSIRNFLYFVGSSPNTSDIILPTTLPANHTHFLHLLTTPLPSGMRVYTTIIAYNRAGLYSLASSNGVIYDNMVPMSNSAPAILTEWVGSESNNSQISRSAMRVAWNFTDNLNTMHHYFVRLLSDSKSRIPILPQTVINEDYVTFSNLDLSDGNLYRMVVIGCDAAGICTRVSTSPPVLVDSSPPIDGFFALSSDSIANLTSRIIPGGMTWRNRQMRGVAQLNLAFLGFVDPHSGIEEYWASVGTFLSASDLLEPTRLTVSLAGDGIYVAVAFLNRLVSVSERLYISLWAVNGVGLKSHIVQASFEVESGVRNNNGSLTLLRSPACSIDSCVGHCTCAARGDLCNVQLSPCVRLSHSSLSPDRLIRVFNVVPQLQSGGINNDPLFTSITDKLYGRWELVNPMSTEFQRLEWTVGMREALSSPGMGLIDVVNDVVWRDTGNTTSMVFSVSEDYPLVDGEQYVFYVRAWYNSSEYTVFTSEGVTVDHRGPVVVRGKKVIEIIGMDSRDQDFSSNPSTLSVSWDGVFMSIMNYSTFQLGIGSISSADNIYPLTSVLPTELMATVSGLILEEGVVYYSMVRATNFLGITVTSVSDGVLVDLTPPIVGTVLGGMGMQYSESLGQVETNVFSVRWFDFNDPESYIHHYELAVTNSTDLPNLEMYENVGISLQTTLTNLNLISGQTYYAHIVGVNGAGLRSIDAVSTGTIIQDHQRPGALVCQERNPEILVNPSFENTTGVGGNGVPCPREPPSLSEGISGWYLNASYAMLASYPQMPPIDGCFALAIIGTISQEFYSIPGTSYNLTFSYKYHAMSPSPALRVQLPGLDRLVSQPDIPNSINNGWQRAQVLFSASSNTSTLTLSSALSNSLVFLDKVSITSCSRYERLSSSEEYVIWPNAINLDHQVIARSKIKISAEWSLDDAVSGIKEYLWAIGTVPGGEQLQSYQSTGPVQGATSVELGVSHGEEVHVTVVARSNAGSTLIVHSRGYSVDLTPPPSVNDGGRMWDGEGDEDVDYQSSMLVGVNWSGLLDMESGLDVCAWAIGSSPGMSDIRSFIPIPIMTPQNTTVTSDLSNLLQHGDVIYSTVICSNKGGLTTFATTDGLTILYLPPNNTDAIALVTSPIYTQYPPRHGYVPTAALTVQWEGFVDSAETALEYEVRVLEEGSIQDEVNWTHLASTRMLSLHQLQVSENVTGHVIEIRASNLGGIVSNPIRTNFSVISSPPHDTGININASWSQNSVLSLDWSEKFVNPAPLYYELSIGTQMGSGRVQRWVELSMTESRYNVPSGYLSRDIDYFVSVTAITSAGLHTTVTQLLPGVPVPGV